MTRSPFRRRIASNTRHTFEPIPSEPIGEFGWKAAIRSKALICRFKKAIIRLPYRSFSLLRLELIPNLSSGFGARRP